MKKILFKKSRISQRLLKLQWQVLHKQQGRNAVDENEIYN